MAEGYGTDDGLDAYVEAMGYTASTRDQTQARLRGSVWLDATYGGRFPGTKTGGRAQERQWPRTGATDREDQEIADDEVPIEVLNASYEAAYREQVTPGSLQPDVTTGGLFKKVAVEGAVSVEYADTSVEGQMPTISIIDGILEPLLGGTVDYGDLFGTTVRTS